MPRKSRLRAKAAQSSGSGGDQWTTFDEQLAGRVRVNERAKQKWNGAQPQGAKGRYLPIAADEALTAADILEIGTTLLDEFDPTEIDLTHKIDASRIAQTDDRAPGVTDEQLQRYRAVITPGQAPNSFAAMVQALKGERPEPDQPKADAELECALPLAWLVEVMQPMPFLDEVKEMYYSEAITLAVHTTKRMASEVWRHAATIYAARKQDVADYIWHAQKIAEASNKRAKHGE